MDPNNGPWITKEGFFDPRQFPIDGILKQAISDDERQRHSALAMLQAMYDHGRKEAGVFLLGLLLTCEDDKLDQRSAIVEALKIVQTQACADLLFRELKRIQCSNTTRRYLTLVIKVLANMPSELVLEKFTSLADDDFFSPRMRAKFQAVLEQFAMEDIF